MEHRKATDRMQPPGAQTITLALSSHPLRSGWFAPQ